MTNQTAPRPLATFVLSAVLLGGCVPDFATDLSELREPRLLAISSSPAETTGGKSVKLTALVAVPEGAATPRLDWSLCLARKSLTELGPVNPACLGNAADEPDEGTAGAASTAAATPALQELGGGSDVDAKLPTDVCKLFGPLRPSPMMGEPAGRPVDPDITGGFYQPVVAKLGGVPSLGAIRIDCDPANLDRDVALSFRKQYRQNENPRINVLTAVRSGTLTDLGAEPLEVKAGSNLELRASLDDCPDSSTCGDGYCTAAEDATTCADDCKAGAAHGCSGAEHYVWYNRETQRIEQRREAITVAWYASSGHFESEQTGLAESEARSGTQTSNVWHVGSPSGNATVWVVIRDSRGGQSWWTQRVSVGP
ncbi:MAG TPA: hypothetical protein VEQ58_15340 [Polyangiaceae bacterium]|nr:hypothetical protein [Polyangiaceae bacterium]